MNRILFLILIAILIGFMPLYAQTSPDTIKRTEKEKVVEKSSVEEGEKNNCWINMTFISNIFVNVIGAFVGFGLAMLLQIKTEKKHKNNTVNKVLLSITEELSDISESIQEYLTINRPLKQKIPVPAWETALYSGIILELIDNEIYQRIISAYSRIKELNETQNTKCGDDDILNLMKEIVDASQSTISNATALINKRSNDGFTGFK